MREVKNIIKKQCGEVYYPGNKLSVDEVVMKLELPRPGPVEKLK